jgi:hypothetical protein
MAYSNCESLMTLAERRAAQRWRSSSVASLLGGPRIQPCGPRKHRRDLRSAQSTVHHISRRLGLVVIRRLQSRAVL